MGKARTIAVLIIGVVLLTVLIPGLAVVASVESPPGKPVNLSPDNATMEISPLHSFFTAAYSGTDLPLNAQWEILRSDSAPSLNSDGSYDRPLWDSGLVTTTDTPSYSFPVGLLEYSQKYWWHVRVQDVTGAWSPWSDQTWFQVIANSPPNPPKNTEPVDQEKDVSLTPTLKAGDFSDPDTTAYADLADAHAASQWQVTATAGNYTHPVWDSDVASPTTSAIVPAGKLAAGTPYYWHVRYQDSHSNWSGYSPETSFTTKSLTAPTASFSADKTEVTAGQEFVTFTDNSTPAGEIAAWSWDFGDNTTDNWTTLTRPSNGQISHKYAEGGSKTVTLTVTNAAGTNESSADVTVHAKPEAKIGVLTVAPKVGDEAAFRDESSPSGDITSWEWQFDDGTTATWTAAQRDAAGGQITHVFKKGGMHTVSLTVGGTLGESFYSKQVNVTGGGGFHFGLWMIAAGVAAVVVIAGIVYLLRARKGK